MKAAVAGYEWKAKVQGGCSDDAVGHVRNNVARNIRKRVGLDIAMSELGNKYARLEASETTVAIQDHRIVTNTGPDDKMNRRRLRWVP